MNESMRFDWFETRRAEYLTSRVASSSSKSNRQTRGNKLVATRSKKKQQVWLRVFYLPCHNQSAVTRGVGHSHTSAQTLYLFIHNYTESKCALVVCDALLHPERKRCWKKMSTLSPDASVSSNPVPVTSDATVLSVAASTKPPSIPLVSTSTGAATASPVTQRSAEIFFSDPSHELGKNPPPFTTAATVSSSTPPAREDSSKGGTREKKKQKQEQVPKQKKKKKLDGPSPNPAKTGVQKSRPHREEQSHGKEKHELSGSETTVVLEAHEEGEEEEGVDDPGYSETEEEDHGGDRSALNSNGFAADTDTPTNDVEEVGTAYTPPLTMFGCCECTYWKMLAIIASLLVVSLVFIILYSKMNNYREPPSSQRVITDSFFTHEEEENSNAMILSIIHSLNTTNILQQRMNSGAAFVYIESFTDGVEKLYLYRSKKLGVVILSSGQVDQSTFRVDSLLNAVDMEKHRFNGVV